MEIQPHTYDKLLVKDFKGTDGAQTEDWAP